MRIVSGWRMRTSCQATTSAAPVLKVMASSAPYVVGPSSDVDCMSTSAASPTAKSTMQYRAPSR